MWSHSTRQYRIMKNLVNFELSMIILAARVCITQYECKKLEEEVDRKMNENRASYSQLLIESLLTPPQSLCGAVVHVENAIT